MIVLAVALLLWYWRDNPVNVSAFMLAQRFGGGAVAHTWVDGQAISMHAKRAAIVSEDAKFVSHHGFDFDGIERAMRANEMAGAVSAGGSTISQQTAKNLFLTQHRSYIKKGVEALLTIAIEQAWDKERILTVYLNIAEFGEGIYGIEAAARHFYGKSAKNLSAQESALLIATLPRPKYYHTHRKDRRLLNKQRIILRRMPSATVPR